MPKRNSQQKDSFTTKGRLQDDNDNEEQDEIDEAYINEQKESDQLKLSLESMKLQDLSFMGGVQWEQLQEIDLHKNFLSSIDILNLFRNLKVIKASNNYIQEINLNLQKLEDLDLSNNYINIFPLLHQLPKIKVLKLNSNKISDLRVEFKPPSSLSLKHLDIGANSIDFGSEEVFNDLLEKLKKLKNLQTLIVANNRNPDEKKFDQIVSQLNSLLFFNYERADEYRKQVMEMDKIQDPSTKKDKGKKTKSKVDKNNFYFPTLEILCFNLEAANSHPSFALDHLKALAMDVDKIISHLDMVEEYFGKGKDENAIIEMIETFMQNAQLLIDNHYELQSIMLAILSKLSIIKFNQFGIMCFNTLKDLMNAGKEMESQVIEVIEKEVINKLKQQNPEQIPSSLLKGLFELVNETEKTQMLKGLFENCFPSWLKIMVEKIEAQRKIASFFDNNEHFDSIIALLSVSVKESIENVQKCVQKELLGPIADILKSTTWEHERYINCLRVVEYISIHGAALEGIDSAANTFIAKDVQTNLLRNIRNSLYVYKKNNDLKDEDSKETEEKIKLKYLTLAAEIDCLGGLLEADKEKREVIIKDGVIDEMLQITSHYKTDPVLLTSICQFAKQLFSRDEIKNNAHLLEPKIKKMQNLVQLIPYLGLKKYEEVLKMSRRYYDSQAFADKEKATQLQHLDDVVVQKLFISIIHLINFFCEEAQKSNRLNIFEEVSASLNESQRETALFNCLEIPNDEVKLAVVECLNNVPLSEFDTEEIATIIRLLGSYKNIGAGKTELVLSKIFWILTKLTDDNESDSGKNFRLKFGEKAISEAIDILIRNQQRQVDDDEEEMEKLALSLSCLQFLKFTSMNAELRRFMINRSEAFKQALYAEEQYSSFNISKYPIEIEDTWLGRSIDVLINAINPGYESICPYNYVSFRVLQRMADILMNLVELDVLNPFEAGVDVIEMLQTHYKDKLKKRIRSEGQYWEDPEIDFIHKLQENDQYNVFYQQHVMFTSSNGIPLLQMFLTKKVPQFEQYLKTQYDEAYDKNNIRLSKKLADKKGTCEFNEHDKQSRDIEKKQKALKKEQGIGDDSEEEEKGINLFRMALQQEDIGINYDPVKSNDHLLQGGSKSTQGIRGKNAENIKKRDQQTGVQNLKMRSLCIAAYLRCLFAAIEYAPDQSHKNEAIRYLKDEFAFRSITQLCDTTGWLECNIGAKYLRVMRHIIKVPFSSPVEHIDHMQHYEILSVVLKKLMSLLQAKIQGEKFSTAQVTSSNKDKGGGESQKQQGNGLTNEDKVLIYELSATCSLLCSQCSLFRWSMMNVKQTGQHSRSRRTPQEKCIDFQISSLFPSQSILTFIDIVFRDMNNSYKVFDSNKHGEAEEAGFIKLKNNMAREYIKLFLGEYLSKCKDNKYDILESFMKGVVYDKKKLRESYLQEILKAMEEASYKIAIEDYIFDNQLSFDIDEKEKINQITWVDVTQDNYHLFKPKLFICTNKGIYLFKASSQKPCSVCQVESLCPEGPVLELKFKYDKIYELITFQHFPQKIMLSLHSNVGGLMKKEQNISLSFIIPMTTRSVEITAYLKEVINNQNLECKDQISTGSILDKVGINNSIKYSRYVSYTSAKGFFGFWSEESIIPNCILLVLSDTDIFLMRENWAKWYFSDDWDKIKSVIDKGADQKSSEVQSIPQTEKQANQKIQQAVDGFLQQITRYPVADIQNLHVHKGKDSVVEIQFSKKTEKLIFQCDYSRQMFIEALLEVKLNKGGDPQPKKK